MENINRRPIFGDFVTIRTEASMQDITVARLQSTIVQTHLSTSFKCNVLRESFSVDSQNIPCATQRRGVVDNHCVSLIHWTLWALSYSAVLHPIELWCTLLAELQCNPCWLPHLNWATLHPTHGATLYPKLSYAAPYWATQHHVSYATPNWATYTILIPLCNFSKCWNAGQCGTGIRVSQSGTGMVRYRTGMLDAAIPMPAASASVPMISYAPR